MPRQLTISMPLAFHVGYGQLALEVFRGLTSRGFDIRVKSMMVDQR